MLAVLSPAKSLDFETAPVTRRFTQPDFLEDAGELVDALRELAPAELASLMGISDPLAALNAGRFQSWQPPFTLRNAKQAVLAFDGDVYDGLSAPTLERADLDYAQKHLRILSGLYGLLRPLDLIQPYRLEMGTRFANARGRDLYRFWDTKISEALARAVRASGTRVLLNLASEEYFKAVQPSQLGARLVAAVFEDRKGDRYRIVSFNAKRARGMMARFMIRNRVDRPEGLIDFAEAGYRFSPEASAPDRLVFRREAETGD